MGDANPIRTLGDYSKPSHEGYGNTIELPKGNNAVPLQSDTIREGYYYSFPYSILSTGKDRKTPQHYSDVPTTSRRISLRSMDSFLGLTPKTHAAGGKLRNKSIDESWEIIENFALYDHEGWNDSRSFVKPVKAISIPQNSPKTPDQRLFELEDQINFLLKGSRPTPRPSSTHTPHAYVDVVYSNPHPQNQNEPPKQKPFEAQVRDYMTTHTERMESGSDPKMPVKEAEKENEAKNGAKNKPIKRAKREEVVEASNSQPVGYYLKHKINEKLIEGLVDNHRFNDSLSGDRAGKMKGKTYNLLPRGPVYEAILKKKITRK
ncbi:hypothetical protein Tco_1560715 [Tanacetum coccineum]